jgi:acyl carrier protein
MRGDRWYFACAGALPKPWCRLVKSGFLLTAVQPQGRADMTTADTTLIQEVAALLVDALNLDTAASDIDPQAPLYGDGLGLDSIDILEVALVVSKRYGFQLRSDDEQNVRIFASLASLADHIAAHRTVA